MRASSWTEIGTPGTGVENRLRSAMSGGRESGQGSPGDDGAVQRGSICAMLFRRKIRHGPGTERKLVGLVVVMVQSY